MASSSSSKSSGLSFQSSNTMGDREPTPEHPPMAAYEALAPQWWDERDWDFAAWSEDDESLTDGEEGLQFLVDGELEAESADDAVSWGEDVESSDEEEEAEEDTSSDEYPPVKRFRAGSSEDTDDEDEDEEAPADNFNSSGEDYAGSSADDSEYDDGEDSGDDTGF